MKFRINETIGNTLILVGGLAIVLCFVASVFFYYAVALKSGETEKCDCDIVEKCEYAQEI